MNQYKQLDHLLESQNGLLRTEQAMSAGITKPVFYNYVHSKELTDREPLQYTVTVKTGYNPTNLKEEGVQVFTIKVELHEVGLTTLQTPFGHDVPVYDMERTICDLLRSRSRIEKQAIRDALRIYASRRNKNLRTLMRYAELFRVEKILRPYLEVLL